MFYKPNFCCECGEKIERTEWKLWTSRRFCAVCEPEKRVFDMLPKALAGVCTVGAIFVLGSYLQSRPTSDLPLVKSSPASTRLAQVPASEPIKRATAEPEYQSQSNPRNRNVVEPAPSVAAAAPKSIGKNNKDDAVYMCGAATKKGTACTRRVKGNVRCWQHTGMPAILPAAKLKISQQ
jgi:hypothetical protein